MGRLDGKVAVITGGNSGIGACAAELFAKEGAKVVISARRVEQLEAVADKIKAAGGEALAVPCDISDKAQCSAVIAKTLETFGTVDILVNNAGISYIGLLTDMTYQQWREVMDTNLNACFLTCRYAVPQMVRRHCGKIINISSVWGNVGASMEVAYSASKGGINAFTRALAKELAPSNIQVNAVACGVIDTDMNKCFDEEEMNILVQEIPADRLGRPEEVAALVVQLCTGNEYLTGQIITLDGGWT